MSKTRKYILCGVAALLTACTTDLPGDGQKAALVPIGVCVGGDTGDVTRAGIEVQEAQFQEGETFYVRFADNSAVDGNGDPLASTKFTTTDGNGTAAPAEGCAQSFFNPSLSSATLHAYYPQTVDETTASFEVAADQTTDAAYKASDLMYATTTALKKGTKVTIPLRFEHRMAKVTVLAVAVDNVTKIQRIRIINGYRKVNIADPATATPGTSLSEAVSQEKPLQMYSNDGEGENMVFTAAVLPPQTVEGDFLEFDTDDGIYTYPIRETNLEGGHAYTLALRVGAEPATDENGGSGSGSGSGSGGSGSHQRITIMPIANQTYTGEDIVPNITVKNGNGETLEKDVDYKVVFSNAIQVGRAQAIVVGMNTYTGCVATAYFNIVQAPGTIGFGYYAVEMTYWPGNTYNGNPIDKVGDGKVTYSTTDTDVVSVNPTTGVVTLLAPGTATITATVADGQNYHYATTTASYTLTVHPRTEMNIDNDVINWGDGSDTNGTVEF